METSPDLDVLFAPPPSTKLPPDILAELQSILRLHSTSPQELFYKWESYSLKMGSDETKLDLPTARAFKKDVQETLEREIRLKAHTKSADKRSGVHATPRNIGNGGDVYGMLDGMVPNTPQPDSEANGSSRKRKAAFGMSSGPKVHKSHIMSSPSEKKVGQDLRNGETNGIQTVSFADRQNAGQIVETLNDQLDIYTPPIAPPFGPRMALKANTDLKKFYYKPMAMHLSEASEVLDDRIDEFTMLVQAHYGLDDSAFGNAASQSTSEIVAVGRIASDTVEGKLNITSIVLETSRKMGAGLRIPIKVEAISPFVLFPGQIVAFRGVNASGEYFSAIEVLEIPLLPPAASAPSTLDIINESLGMTAEDESRSPSPILNILVSAGPFTADDNLAFEPLNALCEKASTECADALLLVGPLFDIEHPLLASGDFDLPDESSIEPDKATLSDAFRALVAAPLRRLAEAVPSITIIIVPSTRDAINKHVSWPQEPLPKKGLGLPKQAKMVSNPVTISLNEMVIGISAQDILNELRREELVVGRPRESNMMARLPKHLIQQRHFFPLFPPVNRSSLPRNGTEESIATGTPLDVSYLKLGEWLNVTPDVLITPSTLTPFAKVVDGVLVVNPGSLSKRKGPGTFIQFSVHPRRVTDDERARERVIGHKLYERARVDIIRI